MPERPAGSLIVIPKQRPTAFQWQLRAFSEMPPAIRMANDPPSFHSSLRTTASRRSKGRSALRAHRALSFVISPFAKPGVTVIRHLPQRGRVAVCTHSSFSRRRFPAAGPLGPEMSRAHPPEEGIARKKPLDRATRGPQDGPEGVKLKRLTCRILRVMLRSPSETAF